MIAAKLADVPTLVGYFIDRFGKKVWEYRVSIATKMAAPMRPRIRRATFVLRRCATGSTLQRFAESTFNGCSVRNGH